MCSDDSKFVTVQIISGVSFIPAHVSYTSTKPKLHESRWNSFVVVVVCFVLLKTDAPCVYVHT